MPVRFSLNGRDVVAAEEEPHVSLLAWLRQRGLTGSKEGCAEGECGACAVALVERDADGRAHYRAVNGCIFPFASVAGRALVTVEGVAHGDGTLHPVQKALVEHAGSQCGYCTPGFVVSLFCAFERDPKTCADPEVIAGNLCRCTGYRPIVDAQRALAATERPARRLPQLPEHAAEPLARFHAPRSLDALFTLRTAHPHATLIAGGTDLMVYANQQGRRFPQLISLEHVAELRTLVDRPDELVIGAGIPLVELDTLAIPMLQQLLPLFSSRLVRGRATLGGSLATASPIGDAAPPLIALGAHVTLVSPRGTRTMPVEALFTGYRSTALAPDELILSIHIPRNTPAIQRFYKVAKRAADDISCVAAAFALELSGGRVTHFRAAYGGIAATPLRAHALEQSALGKPWNASTLRDMRAAAQALGTPQDDLRGSQRYRRALITRLVDKLYADTEATR